MPGDSVAVRASAAPNCSATGDCNDNTSLWLGSAGILFAALAACGGGSEGSGGTPQPPGCVSTATVVCTQYGQLQGAVEGSYRAFRGIPFAAPPVGDLRWRPPAPAEAGRACATQRRLETDARNSMAAARRWGMKTVSRSHVYAVESAREFETTGDGVHSRRGQCLRQCPGSTVRRRPCRSAGYGVIVVTVQYRLGLLGFLAHPLLTAEGQGSSGNYGLMDLIAALKWVHDNIAEFGGDPARVMILGHSWGSVNVEALLASPAAAGLFSAAGMESYVLKGGEIGTSTGARLPLVCGRTCHHGLWDTAADVLACLRAVPAGTLAQSGSNRARHRVGRLEPSRPARRPLPPAAAARLTGTSAHWLQ